MTSSRPRKPKPMRIENKETNNLNSQSTGSTATVKLISYSSTLYFRQCAMHKMDRDRTLANG